ncbi:discoidin domain-containing protein [Paenibacillus thalictri]|uniref:Sheath polysaccharide-degrading enzyme n=1 Tax=Paenibacillus thalictri TaxID=2527873 RepID=A0A4Q9DGQ5_9BACL|nr:discoidin domain-containing protein [Paenibacillus thalictri]TBL71517.1 hypothetical protein EYB31_29495 [Paenibacillus thalictri]
MINNMFSKKRSVGWGASALLGMTALLAALGVHQQQALAASTTCSTASCLTSALSSAAAGDVITLADGVTFSGHFTASANGTAANPITIQSNAANKAILDAGGTGSNYTLYITGDYWVVKNVKITNAKKGIMLDHSNHTMIDGAEVYNIGEEAVHFRDGSSYNTIQNSYIHDAGTVNPEYGEGVYIGSDYGKWSTYAKETDYNVVKNNTIGPNVRAESIDIKEGSTGAVIEGNTFNGTGISGANSADSFMDVKGNNNIIRNNIGYRNGNAQINDAFQTNERQPGWGYDNDFYGNTVYMDIAAGYVVNVKAGSAKVCGNTRNPVSASAMYTGAVTAYTSCGGGDTAAPSIPAGLSAVAVSGSQINLSWTASTDNVGVTGYDIYRGGSFLKNVTGTSASDTGLSPSTTYSYTVRAKDAAGNASAASAAASATTLAGTGASNAKFSIAGSNVTASTSDTNVPANAVDGNLSTRWSGEGDGAWLKLDLGAAKTVAFVKIAFYDGASRTFTFDIQTSPDNTNWTTQGAGLHNAANNTLQTFDFADLSARYVRIVGHGNTGNNWNSLTEVEVWGQ